MRIGVISDTHGLFDESIRSIFDDVDAIIHAGDIGKLEVIDDSADHQSCSHDGSGRDG